MSHDVTLRIRQQGYVRTTGYQAVQWAVTVPVVDPSGTPAIATDPGSYAPLYVIDTAGERETLRRIATLQDYQALPRSELKYFDVRTLGAEGRSWFTDMQLGDTLRILSQPPHWVQEQAPYTDWDFVIDDVSYRTTGGSPSVQVGKTLTLAGYTFTPEDIGRWVELVGFATTQYNGLTQILSYTGNVATVDKNFTTNETGSTWRFPWVRVQEVFSGQEPRYFPTRMKNLSWARIRAGLTICSGVGGGVTCRELPGALVRSVRYTELASTLEEGLALLDYSYAEVQRLQRQAVASADSFLPLTTRTVGP